MNVLSGIGVGLFLLETGGPQAVADARTLASVVQELKAGQALTSMFTTPNLDAACRLLTILAKGLQDPSTRGEIGTFLTSLAPTA